MSDRERLLHRVCLAPDDDLPRLIYADWLDGDGQQERAEFIRVQCLLTSRYPPSIDDRLHCTKPFRAGINMPSIAGVPKGTPMATCKVCEVCRDMGQLRLRELELLHHHEREWMGELGPHTWINPSPYNESRACWVTTTATTWIVPKWERGWIAEITCDAQQWLKHGPAIVRQQPITRVVLSDREPAQISDNGKQYYYWLSPSSDIGVAEYIPGCAYKWLKRGERNRFRWGSPQAAKTALSDAALLWARHEAGLEVQ